MEMLELRGEWPDSDELAAAKALILLYNCVDGGFCPTSPTAAAPKQPSITSLPTSSHTNSATAAVNVKKQEAYSPDTPLEANNSSVFHPKKHQQQPPSCRTATASAAVSVKKQETYSPETMAEVHHDCLVCGKRFQSHQALGGHMTSHRLKPQTTTASDDGNSSAAKRGIHECTTCHRKFPSGQALGGHKRKHYEKPLIARRSANPPSIPSHIERDDGAAATTSHITELNIDLNMPPPEE